MYKYKRSSKDVKKEKQIGMTIEFEDGEISMEMMEEMQFEELNNGN